MSDSTPSSSSAPTGWPRVLPALLGGDEGAAAALDEVAEAVRIEQRTTARAVQLRIDAVTSIDEQAESQADCALWRVEVSLPRGRLRAEHGALLVRDLAEGGTAARARASARMRGNSMGRKPNTPDRAGRGCRSGS